MAQEAGFQSYEFQAGERPYTIGERVRDATTGHAATVRYIGSVASAKDQAAIYLGVEWDDASRGKHDGSAVRAADGVKVAHFTCVDGAGSFIKPKMLTRGDTFGNVMRKRYLKMHEERVSDSSTRQLNTEVAHVKTWNGRVLPIELYGELQIRQNQQVEDLSAVTCRDDQICLGGDDAAVVAPKVETLDVQGNLLYDWSELTKLCVQLPALRELRCSGNRMHMPSLSLAVPMLQPEATCFGQLKCLVMNSCGLRSWAQVQTLAQGLPVVEQLSLAYNELSDLEVVLAGGDSAATAAAVEEAETVAAPGDVAALTAAADLVLGDDAKWPRVQGFSRLHHLDLSNAGLVSWRQVLRFAWLPRLQQLALTDNALPNVWPLPPSSSPSHGGGVQNATTVAAAAAAAAVPTDLPLPPAPAPAPSAPAVTGVDEANEQPAGGGSGGGSSGDDSTYVPKMVEHAAIPKEAITGADRWDAKGAEVVDFVPGSPLEEACKAAPFGHIFQFALSGTRLSSWADLDALNTYGVHTADSKMNGPNDHQKRDGVGWEEQEALDRMAALSTQGSFHRGVRVLRLMGNTPVIAGLGASEVRTLAIARMPFLTMFNGSNVRLKERLEAEKTYLRRVMRELSKCQTDAGVAGPDALAALSNLPQLAESSPACAAVLQREPRFAPLYATFGTQLTPQGAGGTGALSAVEVFNVTLRSMAAGSIEKEPVAKKLPASFQVNKLKLLCKRLFDLEPEQQVLYFETGDKASGTCAVFLDDDEAPISFFGVGDGATIFMNEADLKEIAREKEAWAAQQLAREEEQERRLATLLALKQAERGAELAATKAGAAAAATGGAK